MLLRPFEPKALAAQEVLATAGAHYLSNGLLETGIKHVCTHLWYTSFKRESESCVEIVKKLLVPRFPIKSRFIHLI